MDSKKVKLNILTLGELYNEHISKKKKWSIPLRQVHERILNLCSYKS